MPIHLVSPDDLSSLDRLQVELCAARTRYKEASLANREDALREYREATVRHSTAAMDRAGRTVGVLKLLK